MNRILIFFTLILFLQGCHAVHRDQITADSQKLNASVDDPIVETDIEVVILVDETRIPLGVFHRFKNISDMLPPPGRLSVADAHDMKHGASEFCYSYQGENIFVQAVLFDSDFGLHTAQISRTKNNNVNCTELSSEPIFFIGENKYSLTDKNLEMPLGWKSTKEGNIKTFEREWTYTNDSRKPHMWGACYYRDIRIDIEYEQEKIQRIKVMNWEEPTSDCQ